MSKKRFQHLQVQFHLDNGVFISKAVYVELPLLV
jgi:hypothetical protein